MFLLLLFLNAYMDNHYFMILNFNNNQHVKLFQLYKSSVFYIYIYFQNDIIKDVLNLSPSALEYLFSLSILFSNDGE